VKRRLLSLARRAHIEPPVYPGPPSRPEPTPLPQEALAPPQETNSDLVEPDPPKQKTEPTPRVVVRSRRWYDESERPRFSEMKF
jgi:hypothetical protein